jgi:hypothetical protein
MTTETDHEMHVMPDVILTLPQTSGAGGEEPAEALSTNHSDSGYWHTAEHVLETVRAAREQVTQAIEFYQTQQVLLEGDYEVRRKALVGIIQELQRSFGAITPAPPEVLPAHPAGPPKPGRARVRWANPAWKRIEAALEDAGHPVTISALATHLGVESPIVFSAVALHPERFVRFGVKGNLQVRLKNRK